jgi:branched-chain amino acid transport system substrate-binding protein
LASTVLAVVVGCGDGPPRELRIGLLAVTGEDFDDSSGDPSVRGAELAAEELNAAGGVEIDGRRHVVRILVRRYAPRPDAAATEARALLNRDSVHVLVGPQLSVHAIPVSVIAESAEVPMISPMSSSPQTTAGKRFVFRLAFLDEAQGGVLGRYAFETLQATRAAVLYDESLAYSASVAAEFQRAFEAAGGSVVGVERYTSDQVGTFAAQLKRIAATRPEVLLLPNPSPDVTVQVRETRDLGITARFLGSDTWDMQRLKDVAEADGALVTHQWHYEAPIPEVAGFVERFQTAYRRMPRTTAAMTYDAVHVLAAAVHEAGSLDGDRVVTTLSTLAAYRGATGSIAFNGSGDPARSVALSALREGRIVVITLVDPAS